MFLNTPIVKKLFKRAFNTTGLTVARKNEELIYIAGSKWQIEMDYESMPFKQKAALIELLGELPEVGFAVTADKEGQQSTFIDGIPSLRDGYMSAKVGVKKTQIVINRTYADYQLLQKQEDKSFVAVSREFLQMIDIREIDLVNEGMPCGPCMTERENVLYWHNEAGTLCIELENLDRKMLSIAEALLDIEMEEM